MKTSLSLLRLFIIYPILIWLCFLQLFFAIYFSIHSFHLMHLTLYCSSSIYSMLFPFYFLKYQIMFPKYPSIFCFNYSSIYYILSTNLMPISFYLSNFPIFPMLISFYLHSPSILIISFSYSILVYRIAKLLFLSKPSPISIETYIILVYFSTLPTTIYEHFSSTY